MEITIALAQYPVTKFSSLSDWQHHTRRWVENAVKRNAQLLVFPEYASMELVSLLPHEVQQDIHAQIEQLQQLLPDFTATFSALASEFSCIIVAPSFPVFTGGQFVNRAFVFSAKGYGYQDKWFMTRFENESWGISAGNEKKLTVFESEYGKFGVQICYDVEFPIGSQVLAANGAEMIFAPSCTETLRGATRVHAGARARAMEQQIFTGVSQLIGDAEWSPAVDINFGYGAVYSSPDRELPLDGIVALSEPQQPEWLVTKLDTALNETIRTDGQVFNFKDSQRIVMTTDFDYSVEVCKL